MAKLLNGVLACGLMNIPVGVCTATKRKDIEFRTLHAECMNPIASPKQCPVCQKDNLQPEELAKGFEFAKKQFLKVDTETYATLSAGRSSVIEIKKFVSWDSIDDLQVEKSYLLSPASVLVRPYTLFANAMGNKEVVGLGNVSLWGREYPSMVWTRENGILALSMLYCYDEVVDDTPILDMGVQGLVPDEEQELANMLVAAMLRDLDPQEDLVSHSRRRQNEYLSSLVQGLDFEIAEPEPMPEPTMDVVESLRASIELARSK